MSSAQFYISALNYSTAFAELGTQGGVTALDDVTVQIVQQGEANLANCHSDFRFRAIRTDEGDDNAAFVIVGMAKGTNTTFSRLVGTSIITGLNYENRVANAYCTSLARQVFGSDDAADLFNNRTLLQAEWELAALRNIQSMNDEVSAAAAAELVTTMLTHDDTKDRFYLMYGAVINTNIPQAGDYTDALVLGVTSGATATISFTQVGSTMEKAKVLTHATGTLFQVGEELKIGHNLAIPWDSHWMKILAINDVQRAMLNNEMDVENALVDPDFGRVTVGFNKLNGHYANCTISTTGAGVGSGGTCEVHTSSTGTINGILMTSAVAVAYTGTDQTKVVITFDNTTMVAGSVNTITISSVFDGALGAKSTAAIAYLNRDPATALTTGGVAVPLELLDNIRTKHTISHNTNQKNIMGHDIEGFEQKYLIDFKVVA